MKKRKRNPLSGRTSIKVSPRTICHFDVEGILNAIDRAEARAVRKKVSEQMAGRLDLDPPNYPVHKSIGQGLFLDCDGRIIGADAHSRILAKFLAEFDWYYYQRSRGSKMVQCKVATPALYAFAWTIRPDHWLAVTDMSSGQHKDAAREIVVEIARAVGRHFAAQTGLRVATNAIHANEGCGHGHIVWSPVSEDHSLLWKKSAGVGRRGLRMLGPSHVGTLRLVSAGYLEDQDGSFARKDLADRMAHGLREEPIDWAIAKLVDAAFDKFFANSKYTQFFDSASRQYRDELSRRRENRPDVLRAAKEEAEQEISRLKSELARAQSYIRLCPAKLEINRTRTIQPRL